MPLNRKTFIRYASALAAVSCCPDTSIWKTNPVIAAPANPNPDEAYWSAIRAAFPLSREWTYLNNGTMGPSPYPVIEAVHRGMMESDQLGTYFGYVLITLLISYIFYLLVEKPALILAKRLGRAMAS